ncbi:uncharacterized protein ARMOST_04848 [Armillaria ostoyae]|uniref:Uncharacterized protein n=1 Tax=Armillaria ostoyae TaxID=47428 RepID=A0A284QYJ3_ARMOS|nr:uncharacterized protein ARMOST_04848 [Armillaria ostoyae]
MEIKSVLVLFSSSCSRHGYDMPRRFEGEGNPQRGNSGAIRGVGGGKSYLLTDIFTNNPNLSKEVLSSDKRYTTSVLQQAIYEIFQSLAVGSYYLLANVAGAMQNFKASTDIPRAN